MFTYGKQLFESLGQIGQLNTRSCNSLQPLQIVHLKDVSSSLFGSRDTHHACIAIAASHYHHGSLLY